MRTKTCKACLRAFTVSDDVQDRWLEFVTTCPSCLETLNKLAPRRNALRVPAMFQPMSESNPLGTDITRLPANQLAEVMAWKYRARGLNLTGEPGTMKSRCFWLLLDRLSGEGHKVIMFDAIDFGLACQRHYRDNDTDLWIERLATVKILAFDDFGKEIIPNGGYKSADIENLLFGILDKRNAEGLPMIITTNDDSKTLGKRLSEHKSGAFLRRLGGQFFKRIDFGKTPIL